MASFTYQNITNPSLTNVGIAGDTIQVSVVTTSESVSNQIQFLQLIGFIIFSNPTEGDTALAVSLSEPNIDSSTWIFDIVLADSIHNDGIVNFNLSMEMIWQRIQLRRLRIIKYLLLIIYLQLIMKQES